MTPGQTLKALRRKAELTQAQLADKAGIDRSWYNRMENDARPIMEPNRAKLAKALGVSPLDLGGEEPEAPEEYRTLDSRLAALEAKIAAEHENRERVGVAILERLDALEVALGIQGRRQSRPESGGQE